MRWVAPTGGITASRELPTSVLKRNDRVSARLQPIDDLRKRGNCLRSIAARVVQQDDTAVAPLLLDPLQNDVRARSCPILWIDILEHDEIVHLVGDPQRGEIG